MIVSVEENISVVNASNRKQEKRVREELLVFLNRGQETIWHALFSNKNVPEILQCKNLNIHSQKHKAISAAVENTALSQNVTMTQIYRTINTITSVVFI